MALIIAFVLDDVITDKTVGFSDQDDRAFRSSILQSICNLAKTIECRVKIVMVLMKRARNGWLQRFPSKTPGWCQCAKSIEDDRNIDNLLCQRACDRREPAESCRVDFPRNSGGLF